MKNKIIFILLTTYFFLFNISHSEIIKFESPTINIENDGKKITAKNGVVVESNDGIIINADQAIFNKENNILKFLKNIKVKDNFNSINFNSDEIIYEKNKSNYTNLNFSLRK